MSPALPNNAQRDNSPTNSKQLPRPWLGKARIVGKMLPKVFARKAAAAQATPPAAADIATEAEATLALLDGAAVLIRAGCQAPNASPALPKHAENLTAVRGLVQRIKSQEDLHTPLVGAALEKLKVATMELARLSSAGPAMLATQGFDNAVDAVVQAGKNLRQRLPGDIFTADGNEVKGKYQINAAIGGARGDGRLIVEAKGNKSEDAAQINAPVFGDPAALAGIFAALGGVGAGVSVK
ncbi:hypothetical protein RB601_001394 [Gaeumannomyces tritici]